MATIISADHNTVQTILNIVFGVMERLAAYDSPSGFNT